MTVMTKLEYVESTNWVKTMRNGKEVYVESGCSTYPDGPHSLTFEYNNNIYVTYDEYYTDIKIEG